MIFQHTWASVLNGTKTQTRRIVKPGQRLAIFNWFPEDPIFGVVTASNREVYQVGKAYAVQPGRGQKAVARIRITSIRREDVRTINREDAWAEGFTSCSAFLRVWRGMHDMEAGQRFDDYCWNGDEDGAINYLMTRPAERYQAWALSFEVVA